MYAAGTGLSKRTGIWRLFIATIPTCALLAAHSAAAQLTYDAGTINLSGGYTATGTITTNGTLGILDPLDIISWNIVVTGATPYTFLSTSPGAGISPSISAASPTSIATTAIFELLAQDNSVDLGCLICHESFQWRNSNDRVTYSVLDLADSVPNVEAFLIVPGAPGSAYGRDPCLTTRQFGRRSACWCFSCTGHRRL